jgi:hypothetical protein
MMSDMGTRGIRKSAIEEVLTGQSIDAMTDAERANLVAELDSETPEQRLARAKPLNDVQRKTWRAVRRKMGRPKTGLGSQPISLTVEKGLLRRADAYAKRHGLKRAELVAEGLRLAMGET